MARQNMVVAGVELLPLMFDKRRAAAQASGDTASDGDVLATVRGPARKLLTRERVALNFLQRLSGIATLARTYVDDVAGTNCQHPRHAQDHSRPAASRKDGRRRRAASSIIAWACTTRS